MKKQYVDKSVVKAEIRKRLRYNGTRAELDRSAFMAGKEKEDEYILTFLDTLEVKGVDLEKEINTWFDYGFPNDDELLDYIKETARHFFELGVKAKGE